MHSRMLATAVALTTLVAAPAGAADLLTKAPAPRPFTWAGWYMGINGGYGAGDPSVTITPGVLVPPPPGTLVTAGAPFTLHTAPEGALIGGQIGYNWQFDRAVVGFEADID